MSQRNNVIDRWADYRVKRLEQNKESFNAMYKINPQTGEIIEEIYFNCQALQNKQQTNAKRHNRTSSDCVEKSQRRAKSKLKDYCNANDDLEYFVTLTIDPSKCDRTDYNAIYKKLRVWLNHQQQRKGLKYILVPEYHKDGKGIHFHGLINKALPLEESGRVRKKTKQIIYNLPNWTLGFTTAIKIDKNRLKCFNYITKYITKSREKIGGRWYLSSNNLNQLAIIKFNADYDSIKAKEFEVEKDIKCKKIERRYIKE